MNVLVLDDDVGLLELAIVQLRLFLPTSANQYFSATNLADARKTLELQDIGLALLDYELPDGVGTEIVALIRKTRPACRIVFASGRVVSQAGFAMTNEELLMRESHPDGMLGKPYGLAELKAVLRELKILRE